jgi:hypothetical protein
MVLVQYCLGYFLFPVLTAALLDHLKQHMRFSLLPIFLAFFHVFLKVELGPLHSTQKQQKFQLDKQVCQKLKNKSCGCFPFQLSSLKKSPKQRNNQANSIKVQEKVWPCASYQEMGSSR